jgi:hypothetical protein
LLDSFHLILGGDLMTSAVLNGFASSVTVRLDPPRPASTGPLDVAQTAQEIVRMSRGSPNVASQLIDAYTDRQPQALRDAVERSVAAQLRDNNTLTSAAIRGTVSEGAALRRFDNVLRAAPAVPITTGLTEAQKFDVYASVVQVFGDQPARTDLSNAARNGQPTMLALRNETSTLANRGQGVYDDRMVVLSRDRDGTPHVLEVQGNTEPTAQYDARAGRPGDRAEPGYENVLARAKIEGSDINGDGVRDLGRLAAGSYRMTQTTHNNPSSAGTNESFRPAAASIDDRLRVERDTNGDGRFDRRNDELNDSFKIHSGSRSNTDSAGCQTIQPGDYQAVMNALNRSSANPSFSYVLVTAR